MTTTLIGMRTFSTRNRTPKSLGMSKVTMCWLNLSCLGLVLPPFGVLFHRVHSIELAGPKDELLCFLVGDNVKTFHMFCYN